MEIFFVAATRLRKASPDRCGVATAGPDHRGPAVPGAAGTGKKIPWPTCRLAAGWGAARRESAVQAPVFLGIQVTLHDANGDGVFNSLLFTAPHKAREVSRTVGL